MIFLIKGSTVAELAILKVRERQEQAKAQGNKVTGVPHPAKSKQQQCFQVEPTKLSKSNQSSRKGGSC